MTYRVLLILCVGGFGCGVGFEEEPNPSGSGLTGGDASTQASGGGGTSTSAAGGSGGASAGGAPPSGLSDEHLLVRYYVDEADNGQAPTSLRDAAPDPFDLPIVYTGALEFDGEALHRGLRFDAVGDDARATRLMDATKLDAIDGLTRATVEVVVTLLDAESVGSRLVHVGDLTTESRFSLQATSTTALDFEWRGSNQQVGVWQVTDLATRGPTVVHFVLDTPNADNQERGRLYLDGVRQPAVIDGADMGEAVAVGPGRHLVLGNRESGDRSAQGTIHYAAIYIDALSDSEIASHAGALLEADDAPAP